MINYIRILRPRHWVKNLFLFAAPFFGGKLLDRTTLIAALPIFLAFSLCASASYIYNDVRDIERDKLHPKKKKRALASGRITKGKAILLSVCLTVVAFTISFYVSPHFSLFLSAYLLIQIGYSIYLKHIAIVDIFCIASGFVIRVLAGGTAFHVDISQWLLLTMFMISLVLATGKRLGEADMLNDKAGAHRESLNVYSVSTLSEMLTIASSAALISYALYTIEQFHFLVYTVPVATFGLFRYILLSKRGLGDPTEAMTGDKLLALTVLIWLILVGLIRYN